MILPVWLPVYGQEWLRRVALGGPLGVLGKDMAAPARDLADSYLGLLLDLTDLLVPYRGPVLDLEDRLNLRGGVAELRRWSSSLESPRLARARSLRASLGLGELDLRGLDQRPTVFAYVAGPGLCSPP